MPRAHAALALLILACTPFVACSTEPLSEEHAGTGGSANTQGGSPGDAGASQGEAGAGGVAPIKDPPFGGSCLKADRCTDEWDSLFGSVTLGTLCESESGVFSLGHCDQTPWTKKCTETMVDAIYVSYLLPDGICDGVEEPL